MVKTNIFRILMRYYINTLYHNYPVVSNDKLTQKKMGNAQSPNNHIEMPTMQSPANTESISFPSGPIFQCIFFLGSSKERDIALSY